MQNIFLKNVKTNILKYNYIMYNVCNLITIFVEYIRAITLTPRGMQIKNILHTNNYKYKYFLRYLI